jgi:hypothetical protein
VVVTGCGLQISLFILGAWLLTRTLVKLGPKELASPHTIFAGLILAIQLPICMGVGLAVGGAEGIKAARDGEAGSVAQDRVRKKYWWLDIAISGGALFAAGMVVGIGLRDPVFDVPPPDDPVGITDLRATMAEHWDLDRRLKLGREEPAKVEEARRPPPRSAITS